MLSLKNLLKRSRNFQSANVAIVVFLLTSVSVFAQNNFPATIKVPVTFYDFHSNGSNPEFEKTPVGTPVHLGMVATTLDAQKKPVLGPTPYWDCEISKWFRSWTSGDFTIPNYATAATCSPVITVNYDTAFKNIVIQDSLVFQCINQTNGTYQYANNNFFPLDNRGFGLEGRQHNYSFSMEMHWIFNKVPGLTFQFEGDDDVWAFINNKLVMDIGGIHNATPGSVNVDTIGLTNNTRYSFDFFYCERHITQSDIKITTNLIAPKIDTLLMTAYPSTDSINAGGSVVYVATVKDDTGGVRPEYNKYINWNLRATSADTLLSTNGANNTFKGYTAWRWDTITATFRDPTDSSRILTHIARVFVKPDTAFRVYIVGIGDTARTSSNQNNPHPLDMVTMDSTTNHDTVYAVLYDHYRNWVGKANSVVWASLDTTVNVNAVLNKNFAGNLDRNTRLPSSTFVTASQSVLIPDTVSVVLQTGTITAIRVVDENGVPVTSVNMTTDDTKFLQIQVQWSNAPGVWVNGAGSWAVNPNVIQWVTPPPAGNQIGNWTLDPKTPGQTTLTVAAGGQSQQVPIAIGVADPNQIAMTILTPASALIAGDTILIEQRIQNKDGLVPGPWCKGDAAYSDTLVNRKLPQWTPTITLPGASSSSAIAFGSNGAQCFQNGIDTIKVVLYDAPYTQDTLHQISVFLTTGSVSLKASTTPFILLPGPLDSISIEDAFFKAIPGPITLNYSSPTTFDSKYFYSNGYDRFQNLIGNTNSDWSQTGSLHAIIPPTTGLSRIYYQAVDSNETGSIITQAPSKTHPGVTLYDSVAVTIVGSQPSLDSAVTKDLNGNGYLDQVLLYFNKPIIIDASYPDSNITLRYASTFLAIDSIRPFSADNKVYTVFLHDTISTGKGLTSKTNLPQTGWRPLITMNGLPGNIKVINVKCKDGAGPVIWRVIVNRNVVSDRTKDLVTVIFSESIKSGITGDAFQLSTQPGSVFSVWDTTAGGDFIKLDNVLAGIGGFYSEPDSLTLTFYMKNAKELFTHNYFNILVKKGYDPLSNAEQDTSFISDKAYAIKSNLPLENNQKVQVEIQGAGGTLIVGPNPLIPTVSNGGPSGTINFNHEPRAVTWVRNNGGTIFRVLISPGQGKTTGYIKVYDVVGNLVNFSENTPEMFDQIQSANPNDTSAVYNYDIYWNGTNSKGMKCAPGGYLGVVYLTTTKNGGSTTTRLAQKVGVARKIGAQVSQH